MLLERGLITAANITHAYNPAPEAALASRGPDRQTRIGRSLLMQVS
jgi:hypothetical protein